MITRTEWSGIQVVQVTRSFDRYEKAPPKANTGALNGVPLWLFDPFAAMRSSTLCSWANLSNPLQVAPSTYPLQCEIHRAHSDRHSHSQYSRQFAPGALLVVPT